MAVNEPDPFCFPYQRQDSTIFGANPQTTNAPQSLGGSQLADWGKGWLEGVVGVLNPANIPAALNSTLKAITDPKGWASDQQQGMGYVFYQAQHGDFGPAGQVEGVQAGNVALGMALQYGALKWGGLSIDPTAKPITVAPNGGSIWDTVDTISPGAPWERYVLQEQGLTAPPTNNFKTFDGFDFSCGLGVSCKAMNLDMPGYMSKPSSVYYTLKKYVDDAANFTGDRKAGFAVNGESLTNRRIELAVPPNPTPAQLQQLRRAVDYADQKGIILKITTVK